jgi:hypothetical protein
MRHKLILEISQNESLLKQAANKAPQNRLLVRTAATPSAPSPNITVLRSAPNEFTQHCDIQGGFGGFGFGRF